MEKISAKIKHFPEDFIVEEIGENWECKVSSKENFNTFPEIKIEPSEKEFLWCELEKIDIDHFKAIKDVAFSLGIDSRDMGYAGSKDRKAWTSQRICLFRPDLKKISSFKHQNIYLKNFRWEKRKIKLGYLEGNRFKITLRDLDKRESIKIASTIAKFKFFPNYFGEQRFGSVRNNNTSIGKAILKKDFKKAVMLILSEISENEKEEVTNARKRLIKENDLKAALEYFPFYLKMERQLLFYLDRQPENYLGALKNLDRKTLLMLVHSVQSKIFNDILERALEEGIDFTKEGQRNCLLAGYKTHFSSGRLGDIEQEVLEENEISLEDFDLKEIPFLRIKGAYRKALTEVKNIEVDVQEDEIFNGSKKLILSFILPSGVYATTFLENFFEIEKDIKDKE